LIPEEDVVRKEDVEISCGYGDRKLKQQYSYGSASASNTLWLRRDLSIPQVDKLHVHPSHMLQDFQKSTVVEELVTRNFRIEGILL